MCSDMLVEDLVGEGTPQLYTLCGRGHRSSLRILRHGITVSEIAVTELPGRPKVRFTTNRRLEDINSRVGGVDDKGETGF
jgi:splicing factor 3B subunit 3